MKVAVGLSDLAIKALDAKTSVDAVATLRLAAAMKLCELGRLSSGAAAELAGWVVSSSWIGWRRGRRGSIRMGCLETWNVRCGPCRSCTSPRGAAEIADDLRASLEQIEDVLADLQERAKRVGG